MSKEARERYGQVIVDDVDNEFLRQAERLVRHDEAAWLKIGWQYATTKAAVKNNPRCGCIQNILEQRKHEFRTISLTYQMDERDFSEYENNIILSFLR